MGVEITRRATLLGLASSLASVADARAQQAARSAKPPGPVVINNVAIFDGIEGQLKPGNVLVSDRKIGRISSGAITAPPGATVIDGRGRVLMPGLTDAHWHMVMAPNTMEDIEQADAGLMYANAVAEARRTLMRGFTTIRDVAGPTFGLKAAIDAGVIAGPRVYPSGAIISQTSGHADLAPAHARPPTVGGQPSRFQEVGLGAVVNGVPEVLAAVRQQLRKGASQVKIAVGGGVFTDFDPLDSVQFTPEEMRAAVQAASDWGTYVAAHVYGPAGIRRAIETGVMSIEHGQTADEATVRLIGEKGAWLSLQPFQPGDNPMTPEQKQKAEPTMHWDRVAGWAKRHGVKVAFGTDVLFQPEGTHMQNEMLTRFADVFGTVEALRIGTSRNCELFAMSGRRDPYKEAKLGVIHENAWADVLLIDGDPTKDINVLKDFERNLLVIIKDGTIHKNTLA